MAIEEGALFVAGTPRITKTDNGVIIAFPANASDTGKLLYLGVEIFIPTLANLSSDPDAPIQVPASPVDDTPPTEI